MTRYHKPTRRLATPMPNISGTYSFKKNATGRVEVRKVGGAGPIEIDIERDTKVTGIVAQVSSTKEIIDALDMAAGIEQTNAAVDSNLVATRWLLEHTIGGKRCCECDSPIQLTGFCMMGHWQGTGEDQAPANPKWTARCNCYNNHNSASGRCNARDITGSDYCEDCRRDCGVKDQEEALEQDHRDATWWRTKHTDLTVELSQHERTCNCPSCNGEPE